MSDLTPIQRAVIELVIESNFRKMIDYLILEGYTVPEIAADLNDFISEDDILNELEQ